ncbi:MAG: UDP-4-amino-4,6-dideoxy-N-acetyl-beta-L-altrosamine transaminase [Ignavibacteriaceae bacterium]
MNSTSKIYSYGRQTIDQDDIDAVVEVLKGDWLTQGPYVKKFEDALAAKLGAEYVTAVSNGTAGLHLIGLALGWQKGDIVLTTPITFLASANCILYCSATPDFVDIDPVSYTIDINKLEQKLKDYKVAGKKVKAVVAVDYAGHPCDWKNLKRLAEEFSFQLVNDNCHALGAEIHGDITYAVKYADVVNLSFHPVKHITTGEGGAVLTNNCELDEKIKILRTHGIVKDNSKFIMQNSELIGPWYFEMQELGFNYRITDFQCALGISQLKKLDYFVSKRNEIANFYDETFNNDERFIIPNVQKNLKHGYHLYPLQIKFENLKISKKGYFEKMRENNIGLQVHYIPIHLQPYYKNNFGFKEKDYATAESFYEREVSIPIYPTLQNEDIKYIVDKIKELAF